MGCYEFKNICDESHSGGRGTEGGGVSIMVLWRNVSFAQVWGKMRSSCALHFYYLNMRSTKQVTGGWPPP